MEKKVKKKRKLSVSVTPKQIFIFLTAIFGAMFLLMTLHVVMSFVTVGDVEIVGVYQPYERSDIMQTTKIRSSDFWLAVDTDEIERRLLSERKYLEKAEVRRQFPNKIIIKVESKTARWYVEIAGRKYALDSDLRVIDETQSADGATKLILPNISRVIAGEVPVFGQSEIEVKETLRIIDAVRSSSLSSDITELNVSDRTNIRLKFGGNFDASLGGAEDLSGKLDYIDKLFDEESIANSAGGTFHGETFSTTGYVSFEPM